MNHSPAYILRSILLAQGIVTDHLDNEDWACFIGMEPDKDTRDNIVVVVNREGRENGRLQIDGRRIEKPGVQFVIRGDDSERAYAKAKEIEQFCNEELYRTTIQLNDFLQEDGNDPETYSVYLVESLTQTSLVLSVGREPGNSNRYIFSINYVMTHQLTSTGSGS